MDKCNLPDTDYKDIFLVWWEGQWQVMEEDE